MVKHLRHLWAVDRSGGFYFWMLLSDDVELERNL